MHTIYEVVKINSLWADTVNPIGFDTLDKNINTQVLIIGGGISGILVAHRLNELGIDNVLLEADRIGKGVTQNTTAKITSQHGLMYHKLIEDKGYEQARLYAEINQRAIEQFGDIIRRESIACDYERRNAYLFGKGGGEGHYDQSEQIGKLGVKYLLLF